MKIYYLTVNKGEINMKIYDLNVSKGEINPES